MATYVLSDVHGLQDRYDRMKEELPLLPEDTLYILGDVIDRGVDGIHILQDIMKLDNIKMLLGNHEYMMLQYYQALDDNTMNLYEKMVILDRWQRNHCQVTQKQFAACRKQEQAEILDYIAGLPLAFCDVGVNGYRYYLVHGSAVLNYREGIVYREDLTGSANTVEQFVWDRVENPTIFFDDRCVILGHTPTLYLQESSPYTIYTYGEDIQTTKLINIDCGCAAQNQDSRLAVLRLEDRCVFYF